MAAASLNSLYNVLLKDKGKSITLYNHPLPRPPLQVVMAYLYMYMYAHVYTLFFSLSFFQATEAGDVFGFVISVLSVFGLCFLFASFIIILVQERDTKVCHYHYM